MQPVAGRTNQEYNDRKRRRGTLWLEATLKDSGCTGEAKWSESIAVGSEKFAKRIKEGLGVRAKGRE
jgi:hypothetical protein